MQITHQYLHINQSIICRYYLLFMQISPHLFRFQKQKRTEYVSFHLFPVASRIEHEIQFHMSSTKNFDPIPAAEASPDPHQLDGPVNETPWLSLPGFSREK